MTEKSNRLLWAAMVLLLSVGISIYVTSHILHPSRRQGATVDLRQKVLDRGTIRAGYYVGAPYFMKDPNTGKVSGIFADVFTEVCTNLALKPEWAEEVGFGAMIEGLDAGRFDVVASGIWINASRARAADFTVPVLFDAVSVFGRADDHRFDADLQSLNSPAVKISTIDGEMAALIAQTDFPSAALVSLPQSTDFTQMILNVVDRKADVTFLGLAPANKFSAAHPGTIRNLSPNHPLRVFPTAIMVKRDQYALKRMLDLALTELMNNGRVEAIIKKYEELPGSHFRVAPPYAQ